MNKLTSLLLASCLLFTGCQSTQTGSSGAGDTIKTEIAKIDNTANSFLQNPLTEVGAEPAGKLVSFAGLLAFKLSGGDAAPFADQICYWTTLVYSAMSGPNAKVTPDQVDAIGVTFNAHLNATDPKFAVAFGTVQDVVKRIIGTPGVSSQTILSFLKGIGDGASMFCSNPPTPAP